jgi:hypothetical protein
LPKTLNRVGTTLNLYQMKKLLFPTALIGLFLAAFWFTACQKDTINSVTPTQTHQATDLTSIGTPNADLPVTDRANGNSKVFPPTAHPYGKSYAEWSEVWLQQCYTYDCATVPWVHPESVLFYENGPVYILAGIAEVGGSADITIPHGKAVLFPLVNVWWNHPCPFPGWDPPAGVSMEDWLQGLVEENLTAIDVSSLSVTVDGDAVSNLGSYKFVSELFDCTGNPDLANCFDPCVNGEPQPSVMGGYFVMLKPLTVGQHAVHYHMEAPAWGAVQDATFNITVE